MRYMVTTEFPVEVGNRYRHDPEMRRALEGLFARAHPEALYLGLMRRLVYMVVDTEDPALLADIFVTLVNLTGVTPEVYPVAKGDDFVRLSNALAGEGPPV